jgi:hypothetical protein
MLFQNRTSSDLACRMKQSEITLSTADATDRLEFDPVQVQYRSGGWTPDRQRAFLEEPPRTASSARRWRVSVWSSEKRFVRSEAHSLRDGPVHSAVASPARATSGRRQIRTL